jgi:hypothetical protein
MAAPPDAGVATIKLYPSRTKSSVIGSRDFRHVLRICGRTATGQISVCEPVPLFLRAPKPFFYCRFRPDSVATADLVDELDLGALRVRSEKRVCN